MEPDLGVCEKQELAAEKVRRSYKAEVPLEKQSVSLNTIQVYGEVNGNGTTSGAWGSSETPAITFVSLNLTYLQPVPFSFLDPMVQKLQGWIKKGIIKSI